jgi:lysozyme
VRLSDNGRKLIQGFEGLSLKAYKDADGYSIGYGHFGAKPGDVITREQADKLFDQDAVKYETAVSLTTPNATQQQFDAMTSLAYNIGTGGFAGSTVARLHNMGDWQGAADAFRMWNKSQGAVLPVLSARREQERGVYLNGYPGHGYSEPPMSVQSGAPIAWSVPGSQSEPLSASLGSVAPAAGLALVAGAGLLFFCPVCAARVAEIGLEIKR